MQVIDVIYLASVSRSSTVLPAFFLLVLEFLAFNIMSVEYLCWFKLLPIS